MYIGSTKNLNIAKISSIVTNWSRLNKKGIIMSLIIDVFTHDSALKFFIFVINIINVISVRLSISILQ